MVRHRAVRAISCVLLVWEGPAAEAVDAEVEGAVVALDDSGHAANCRTSLRL